MKKSMFRSVCCGALALLLLACPNRAAADAEAAGTIRLPFRDLNAEQITKEMGLGWNLGNTMDGHSAFMPSETAWQSVVTSSQLIQSVHDAGFNTLRIPVTWGLKIDNANNYAIDPAWMDRVREIAEYGLRQGMYVIINIHHDGAEQTGWLSIAKQGVELDMVKDKFARVWQQIAEAFAGYDEHVIFESMNEVKSADDSREGMLRDFKVIHELNQIFVNTVRSTGGNNTRRWLLVPGRYTNIVHTTNEAYGFKLPDDPWNEQNRLMVSVHDYDYSFGLLDTMGITSWSEESAQKMAGNFKRLADMFTSRGVPVVLGEYGAMNKNNTEARAYYYKVMARLSRQSGVVCCAWDNGWYDRTKEPADYSMALFDRAAGQQLYPEIISAILRGHYGADEAAGLDDFKNIVRGTKEHPVDTVHISSLTLPDDKLWLTAGSSTAVEAEAAPADANEAVLYSTSDPSVATVYDGLIRAQGIGRCTVYAASKCGGVRAQIEVTVYPDDSLSTPFASIQTDAEVYTVPVSGSAQIKLTLPDGTDDVVSFISSDASVATVGRLGTIAGKSVGTAWVVLMTRSGLSKTVRVDVVPAFSPENSLEVAINAYYNDREHSFFGNCRGESVVVAGNGTYTLTFDCATDLSEDAAKAGVESLAGVGAIYLADTEGSNGLLASCDIFYDEVLLDGQALTITQTEPKTALKAGNRFDTNDPVNAWDGSSVAEATAQNHVISFEGHTEPKTITVTFTLSSFVLARDAGQETAETIPAAIVLSEKRLQLETADTVLYQVALSPANTTDTACFVSGNPGVVWVSPVSAGPDAEGLAAAGFVPLGPGEATVSIRTQSGGSREIAVTSAVQRPELGGVRDVYIEPSAYILPDAADSLPDSDAEAPPEVQQTPLPGTGCEPAQRDLPLVTYVLIGAAGGAAVLGIIVLILRIIEAKKRN